MTRKVDAIFENGLLRPLQPLEGVHERDHVQLTLERVLPDGRAVAHCVGTLSDEDAEEMRRIIQAEFEQVNLGEW